jgi:hypothetical protein
MNRIHLVIAGLVVSFSCFSEVECSAGSLQKAKHWAFDPPVRPDPPSVGNASWVRNPIDHFIKTRKGRIAACSSSGEISVDPTGLS